MIAGQLQHVAMQLNELGDQVSVLEREKEALEKELAAVSKNNEDVLETLVLLNENYAALINGPASDAESDLNKELERFNALNDRLTARDDMTKEQLRDVIDTTQGQLRAMIELEKLQAAKVDALKKEALKKEQADADVLETLVLLNENYADLIDGPASDAESDLNKELERFDALNARLARDDKTEHLRDMIELEGLQAAEVDALQKEALAKELADADVLETLVLLNENYAALVDGPASKADAKSNVKKELSRFDALNDRSTARNDKMIEFAQLQAAEVHALKKALGHEKGKRAQLQEDLNAELNEKSGNKVAVLNNGYVML